MARTWKWEHNIWTGDAIHRVDKNTRIVRSGRSGPYKCEYWGDYSLKYPISGFYKPTAEAALATCGPLRKKRVSTRSRRSRTSR